MQRVPALWRLPAVREIEVPVGNVRHRRVGHPAGSFVSESRSLVALHRSLALTKRVTTSVIDPSSNYFRPL